MTQNVWEQEAVKDLVQLEEGEFNLCDFALFLSVMKNETAHRNVLRGVIVENNWKEIWKKRTDHFDEIDMAAPEVIFLELKRIDALMYGAKLYDSL